MSLLQVHLAQLAEATVDPVWLADQLCSEGIVDRQIKRDLLTTSGMSDDEKSIRLWSRISTAVKLHSDPKQVLLNVCYIMKQRTELKQLAASMIRQLKPDGEHFWRLDITCCSTSLHKKISCIEPSLHGVDFFLDIFLWRLVSVLF